MLFLPSYNRGVRGTEGCRILNYVPDRALAFTFSAPPHLEMGREHTWVSLSFQEVAGATELTLSHCGFGDGPEWAQCHDYFRKAWPRALRRFVTHWEPISAPMAAPASAPIGVSAVAGNIEGVTIDLRDLPLPQARTEATQSAAATRPQVR